MNKKDKKQEWWVYPVGLVIVAWALFPNIVTPIFIGSLVIGFVILAILAYKNQVRVYKYVTEDMLNKFLEPENKKGGKER